MAKEHQGQSDIQLFNKTSLDIPLSSSTLDTVTAAISKSENCVFHFIELVYVDEEEILRINNEHLGHNYVTDIITFQYDESDRDAIEGTMFCCAPRIIEQASEFSESKEREFLRIYIHGLLHLAGYSDKTAEQQQQMTAKEDEYLNLVN